MAVITGSGGSENLFGTDAADFIDALGGDDSLIGSGGGDTLAGGSGNDSFDGGLGADIMTGAEGSDSFFFRASESAVDRVADFVRASDKLVFDNNFYTEIGSPGAFGAGDARFAAGAGITSGRDATDRLVYDTDNGNLYYDPDGSGAGASRLVATLEGAPALAATDLAVVGQGGADGGGVEIIGGTDPDRLSGSRFNDTIAGGMGADTVEGGAGGDLFIVTAGDVIVYPNGIDSLFARLDLPQGSGVIATLAHKIMEEGRNGGGAVVHPDTILDFTAADQLLFENSVLAALGGEGTWAAGDGRFAAGAGFTSGRDGNDRLVYDTSTGSLYYDPDGSGAAAAHEVVTLQGAPTLAASDITII